MHTYSGFNFLSLALITVFSIFSKVLIKFSSSFRRNSSEMMSKSRTGSTSPSTWVTSGSSNAPVFIYNTCLSIWNFSIETVITFPEYLYNLRHKWKMASQAAMCDKKAFPRPCPSAAPLTKPAISTTFKYAGTLLKNTQAFKRYTLIDQLLQSFRHILTWLAYDSRLRNRNEHLGPVLDFRLDRWYKMESFQRAPHF